ncbi:hypothetical protein QQX09_13840 [Demequina sp. SYSU T00192]|uniref:DUF4245 domain-containing protein n=1 Tax=Demequina litoralis TaxID=3051660 RepID=A0ABT8GCR4_9MICO|nr:hypothetical protein [Demequina sp. SYSU T00192]MDN4476936.1 hypothetical protein [Demequina sp. SYSU T00192]
MIAGQQPSAHQDQGPVDPSIGGVSAGGDGVAPLDHRNRLWPALLAIVVVAAFAVFAWNKLTDPVDSAARAAMAADGIAVQEHASDVVTVTEPPGGGYQVFVSETVGTRSQLSGATYIITPATDDPTGDGEWQPYPWEGVDAYSSDGDNGPLYIDAGAHRWLVTLGGVGVAGVDEDGRWDALVEHWDELHQTIEFVPAS